MGRIRSFPEGGLGNHQLDRRVLPTSTQDDRGGRVGFSGDAVTIGLRLKVLAAVDGNPVSEEIFQSIGGAFPNGYPDPHRHDKVAVRQ